MLASFEQMGPQAAAGLKHSPLGNLYPDKDWAALFTKLHDLLTTEYDWSAGVSASKVPTMLVFADADALRPAHITEFYGLLGGGLRDAGLDGSGRAIAQLAVLPGCTHYTVLGSPLLAPAILNFLGTTAARP